MKVTWKPHTKKPAVSSQYPRCCRASASASPSFCSGPVPAGAAGRPESAAARGTISAASSPRPTSPPNHSNPAMNPCATGSMTN